MLALGDNSKIETSSYEKGSLLIINFIAIITFFDTIHHFKIDNTIVIWA